MNFTREPIIETIITPKEGFRLSIRNTKGGSSEYSVDAVEVVNFGTALFYRSLERPKSFLLPMSDYEVVELKETRVAIKSAQVKESVKITSAKPKEKSEEAKEEATEKKQRRSRRRKNSSEQPREKITPPPQVGEVEGGDKPDDAKASSHRPASLFAPPESLISEKFKKEPLKEDLSDEVITDLPQKDAIVETSLDEEEVPLQDPDVFETTSEVERSDAIKLPSGDSKDE